MKKTFTATAAIITACLSLAATMAAANIPMSVNAPMAFAEQGAQKPGQQPMSVSSDAPFRMETGTLLISEPGNYILTGQMTGTVFVDPKYGEVNITLDGAGINGQNGPAIAAISGERLNINIAAGSVNYMGGASRDNYGAVLYSNVPVEIGGNGQLDMMSMGRDAIRVENNDITFSGGSIRMETQGYGIEAQNAFFNGGNVTFDAGSGNFAPGTEVVMGGGTFGTVVTDYVYIPTNTGSYNNTNYENTWTNSIPTGNTGTVGAPAGNTVTNDVPSVNTGTIGAPTGGSEIIGAPSDIGGGQFPGGQMNNNEQSTTDTAGEVVEGITENSAMTLEADYDNATTYDVSENSEVKITSSGTYIVTGSSEEGSITVKKGTTGVVLILDDLDLSSSSGAALSINKQAEVQVIISGTVNLTDNENPDDENSADADVADAYDGAAIKIKADSVVFITGDGTLNINGKAKNGIKAGDDSSLIIGGDLELNIEAVNDGINSNYDITILSGDVNIDAGDDGIHADHILTIGKDGTGPVLTVTNSNEGLEGTVVNIGGGNITVNAADDAINAANGDGVYEGVLGYSINITGGKISVTAGTDGLDSNGNVNLINGSLSIKSANNGGDAGIDYDGEYYVSPDFDLNNQSGVAGSDGMPGDMGGGMPGEMSGGMPGDMGGRTQGGMPGDMGGTQGGMPGQQSGGMFGSVNGIVTGWF